MRVLVKSLSPTFELIFGDTIPKFCRTHMRVAFLSFSLYIGDVFFISGAPWYFSRKFYLCGETFIQGRSIGWLWKSIRWRLDIYSSVRVIFLVAAASSWNIRYL